MNSEVQESLSKIWVWWGWPIAGHGMKGEADVFSTTFAKEQKDYGQSAVVCGNLAGIEVKVYRTYLKRI